MKAFIFSLIALVVDHRDIGRGAALRADVGERRVFGEAERAAVGVGWVSAATTGIVLRFHRFRA